MSPDRLIYQNWIAERGPAPVSGSWACEALYNAITPDGELDELREIVTQAVETLDEQERFLVFRYYYLGQSLSHMSILSGRARYRLAALHRRALRKLGRRLADFVKTRYGLSRDTHGTCPVCRSPYREEMEAIISCRDRSRNWKPVVETLKDRYGLIISTPQILIGHEKYH